MLIIKTSSFELVSKKHNKKEKYNAFAICTNSTGREDKAKYERCVMDVKKKQKTAQADLGGNAEELDTKHVTGSDVTGADLDREERFLEWLYGRMVLIYKEPENEPFMIRFKNILSKIDKVNKHFNKKGNLTEDDKTLLISIYRRIINVHKVSPNMGFMHKFKDMIDSIKFLKTAQADLDDKHSDDLWGEEEPIKEPGHITVKFENENILNFAEKLLKSSDLNIEVMHGNDSELIIVGTRRLPHLDMFETKHAIDDILHKNKINFKFASSGKNYKFSQVEDDDTDYIPTGGTGMPHGQGYPNNNRDLRNIGGELSDIIEENTDKHSNLKFPFYVSAYDITRAYGGPEEGGWWYNDYELLESIYIGNVVDANEAISNLENKYRGSTDGKLVIYGEKVKGSEIKDRPNYE